jgi:hypothetical protein
MPDAPLFELLPEELGEEDMEALTLPAMPDLRLLTATGRLAAEGREEVAVEVLRALRAALLNSWTLAAKAAGSPIDSPSDLLVVDADSAAAIAAEAVLLVIRPRFAGGGVGVSPPTLAVFLFALFWSGSTIATAVLRLCTYMLLKGPLAFS